MTCIRRLMCICLFGFLIPAVTMGHTPAEAAYSKATLHGKSSGCPAGSFFDPRNGGECWSCPGGYNRTAYAVTDAKACAYPAREDLKPAAYHKKAGCHESRAFFDPRGGGECWRCPGGYNRTAYAVTSDKACSKATGFLQESLRKAEYLHKSGCASGQFLDPRGGGECWSCPGGHNRTAYAVTDQRACSKRIPEVLARAAYKSKFLCPSGQFLDPRNGGECWSCPASWHRTTAAVTGPRACTNQVANMLVVDTAAMCTLVVSALREGTTGFQRVMSTFQAAIDPVMRPVASFVDSLGSSIKSPVQLDQMMDRMAAGLRPYGGIIDEMQSLQNRVNAAGPQLQGFLLDPNMICNATNAQRDQRLIALGLRPNLRVRSSGLLEDFFAGKAYAAAKTAYAAYSISFSVTSPQGASLVTGFSVVTNFAGSGGVYWSIGYPVGAAGVSVSVGAQIFPYSDISEFEGGGAGLSFGAGGNVEKIFKKAGRAGAFIPDSFDVSFDPLFRVSPGFGVSRSLVSAGGGAQKLVNVSGSISASIKIAGW